MGNNIGRIIDLVEVARSNVVLYDMIQVINSFPKYHKKPRELKG